MTGRASSARHGAHPRAGGENFGKPKLNRLPTGSSPRGRGKRHGPVAVDRELRLIPARAGKTCSRANSASALAAHPRAGGENPRIAPITRMMPGSSPRGRGKLLGTAWSVYQVRLIPARAGKTGPMPAEGMELEAHPRAGGENVRSDGHGHCRRGSSPRGRGKPVGDSVPGVPRRLIPARAGKTWRRRAWRRPAPAHPRAGGENAEVVNLYRISVGSSPRGRGKRGGEVGLPIGARLIPARAGKTVESHGDGPVGRAHPRAGGENPGRARGRTRRSGSSPRGRGKRSHHRQDKGTGRLIPARAGKTCRRGWSTRTSRAHPRAGGENCHCSSLLRLGAGSSPRGRGKPSVSGDGHWFVRLIPARAGKTCQITSQLAATPAHPRAGGENRAGGRNPVVETGSSPRGRGKRACGSLGCTRRRLIPARAGKTRPGAGRARPAWAHPRAGGENTWRLFTAQVSVGSSPRGRGKPSRDGNLLVCLGLIPARAGKTPGTRGSLVLLRAHPRAGGENAAYVGDVPNDTGSSPRGRGKHFLTCAFIERIGQILETLELAVSSGNYSLCDVYATDAPRDPARSIGLVPLSNRDASSESVLRSRRASRDLPTSGKRGPARCAHDRPSRHVLSSCSP